MVRSFLDLAYLEDRIPDSILDEMRIAKLHNIDIDEYAMRYKGDSDRVHYIRLLIQEGHIKSGDPVLSMSSDILKVISKYIDKYMDFRKVLNAYMVNGSNNFYIEESSLIKILIANMSHPKVMDYDFKEIPPELVDTFIYGISQDVDIRDIQKIATSKDPDVVNLLVYLKVAGVSVKDFLNDSWSTNQIYALISGDNIITPAELIQDFSIDSSFSDGSIREVIRAITISEDLASFISYKDTEDDVPIYNQYQMYEIVEGARLNLDVRGYCDPSNTDLQMRLAREKLMEEQERIKGKVFKERALRKVNIKIDDSLLDQLYNSYNKD